MNGTSSRKSCLELDSGDILDEQSLASLQSHDDGVYTLNDGGDSLASASADDDVDVFGMSME